MDHDPRHRTTAPHANSLGEPSELVAMAPQAIPGLVAPRSSVRPVARGLVDSEYRERILRRLSVSVLDVGECRWSGAAGFGVAGRADLSGASCLGARRGLMAGMGDGWDLRPVLTQARSGEPQARTPNGRPASSPYALAGCAATSHSESLMLGRSTA